MTFETPPDPDLMDWNEIPEVNWAGILIGNGASRAVWDDFRYDSLFTIAQSPKIEHPMTQDIVALFDGLGTRSFERVLHALGTTAIVSEALGLDGQRPRDIYASVQRALIEAVRSIHPQWNQVPEDVLTAIRDALRDYAWVYSTNYDLLVYWSIMADGQTEGFKDYFWNTGGLFDPTNTWIEEEGETLILFLHGALHLETDELGRCRKRMWEPGANLLESFQRGTRGLAPLVRHRRKLQRQDASYRALSVPLVRSAAIRTPSRANGRGPTP